MTRINFLPFLWENAYLAHLGRKTLAKNAHLRLCKLRFFTIILRATCIQICALVIQLDDAPFAVQLERVQNNV